VCPITLTLALLDFPICAGKDMRTHTPKILSSGENLSHTTVRISSLFFNFHADAFIPTNISSSFLPIAPTANDGAGSLNTGNGGDPLTKVSSAKIHPGIDALIIELTAAGIEPA
jgi:hypothetical protein